MFFTYAYICKEKRRKTKMSATYVQRFSKHSKHIENQVCFVRELAKVRDFYFMLEQPHSSVMPHVPAMKRLIQSLGLTRATCLGYSCIVATILNNRKIYICIYI